MESQLTISSTAGIEEGSKIIVSTPDNRWWMRLWMAVTFRDPPMRNESMIVLKVSETTITVRNHR